MLRFRQRSIPFVNNRLGDDWEALFVMQHHGVPTRLLDWSESPFIGLFFATAGRNFKVVGRGRNREIMYQDDAVVWFLDPIAWNRHALHHLSFKGEIPFSNDSAITPYKPPLTTYDFRNLPIAINGAHNSSRIVAQRGAFTIFGNSVDAMERIYETENFPVGALAKVVISKELIPKFREAIFSYGIAESVVFPDLDGLARETRREFGFED